MRPHRWPTNDLQGQKFNFLVLIDQNSIDLYYIESIRRVLHLYLNGATAQHRTYSFVSNKCMNETILSSQANYIDISWGESSHAAYAIAPAKTDGSNFTS